MDSKDQLCKFADRDEFDRFQTLFPDMDKSFMYQFALAMQMLHHVSVLTESYFSGIGLSKARFVILVHLLVADPEKGESISDLIPEYNISSASMTGTLDTLERNEMIQRIPNPDDRRRVNVRITDSGRKFMMDFLPRHQENAKEMSEFMTDQEKNQLGVILGKLVEGMEKFLGKSS